MSLKLATDLGLKNGEGSKFSMKNLMPFGFDKEVAKEIRSNSQTKILIPFLVPLMRSNKALRLKELVCYIQIYGEEGFKFLYQFRNV